MAANEVKELLESAAPTPRAPLDIEQIERRAHRRQRHRRMTVSIGSLLVIGSLIALAGQISDSRGRDTVAAGPASSRRIPIELGERTATVQVRLLDGTQVRLTLPAAVGRDLVGMTLADLELHGSLYADPAARPPRGWAIDVAVGSVERLIPGGEPLEMPSLSPASAATIDRETPPGHRLGLQFGSWTLVVRGDSITDADINALLTGVALAESPDGFVEYRGPFPLWLADAPEARLGGSQVGVSVFLYDSCPEGSFMRPTPNGLESYRVENAYGPGGLVELCDRVNRLRIRLDTPRPLTDQEIDAVRVKVLSIGQTLAAVQRGEHR